MWCSCAGSLAREGSPPAVGLLVEDFPVFGKQVGLGCEPSGEDFLVRGEHADGAEGVERVGSEIVLDDLSESGVVDDLGGDVVGGREEEEEHIFAVPAGAGDALADFEGFDGLSDAEAGVVAVVLFKDVGG